MFLKAALAFRGLEDSRLERKLLPFELSITTYQFCGDYIMVYLSVTAGAVWTRELEISVVLLRQNCK